MAADALATRRAFNVDFIMTYIMAHPDKPKPEK
jgi:hypothetical protein